MRSLTSRQERAGGGVSPPATPSFAGNFRAFADSQGLSSASAGNLVA
jgi:hypothetical protein